MDESASCFVSEGMCRFLRVARWAGLAPLRFQRDGAGWRAALSRRWAAYGLCMVTLIIPLQPSSVILLPSATSGTSTTLPQHQRNSHNTLQDKSRHLCDQAAEIHSMEIELHSFKLREARARAKLILLKERAQEIKQENEDMTTMVAIAWDLQLPPEATVRMRNQIRRVVWLIQAVFMALSSWVVVCSAPAQARDMIACFNHLKEINAELNILDWPPSLSKRAVVVLISQAVACVVFSVLSYMQMFIAANRINEEATWINGVYCCYFLSYWILDLRKLQFIVTVLHVRYSFTVVNKHLKYILQDLENSKNVPDIKYIMLQDFKNIKQVNNYVGNVLKARDTSVRVRGGVGGAASAVRRLALVYGALCAAVRGVERSHGVAVLLLLATFVLHLVCTPYFFITYLLKEDVQPRSVPLYVWSVCCMQMLWCCYHIFDLVIIVEPCHLTHYEMSVTRSLVGEMSRCARTLGPLRAELDRFHRYLVLNHVYYEPLKIARLSRALIFTLLGSITTYTVVILQV